MPLNFYFSLSAFSKISVLIYSHSRLYCFVNDRQSLDIELIIRFVIQLCDSTICIILHESELICFEIVN